MGNQVEGIKSFMFELYPVRVEVDLVPMASSPIGWVMQGIMYQFCTIFAICYMILEKYILEAVYDA